MTPNTLADHLPPTATYKVAAESIAAKVFLAFLTTAGIFYINIMPAVVNGLKDGLAFTTAQAGFVSSANLYGAATGALAAVFLVKKINWRSWAYSLLVALIIIDLACIFIQSPTMMISVRAFHGIVGGLLVGIGFAIISRTAEADKTFGYLLFIQWGLGGLGLMYLPGLVPEYGTMVLFVALLCFTVVTLMMLPFLPEYPLPEQSDAEKAAMKGQKINRLPLSLNLLGIFLFQAANMGLFAYMIGLGRADGLTIDFMSPSLGLASWVALIGALLVIVIGTKYGRALPLTVGILLTALCSWLLHFSESQDVYLYANIMIGVCWAFVLPYLFGICSELDRAGQLAALGGFASKMGLASGPMVGALMLGTDNYGVVINVAAIGLIICAVVVLKPSRLLDKA
ncbi:MAG: putative MFS family arabinose efflux permease [Phenylobacterium sp.]|jgi:predicted MFS family arabinose efflux permease